MIMSYPPPILPLTQDDKLAYSEAYFWGSCLWREARQGMDGRKDIFNKVVFGWLNGYSVAGIRFIPHILSELI